MKKEESEQYLKYKKDIQKLATSTLRIRVLEEYIGTYKSKVNRYERQIKELEEELVECFYKIGTLYDELNELRSQHNKLKNHWLVKLLRL